jgi:hypothetical protein
MERIYVFLIRNDVWIYILCGLGLIWYLSELWRSRRLLRGAMFGLEKERGQRLQRRSLFFIFLLSAVIALVVYVNTRIAPTLPPEILRPPTPTPNIFATPLSSPTPIGGASQRTPTIEIAPTVTLPSPPGPEPGSTNTGGDDEGTAEAVEITPTVVIAGCSAPVNITFPASGVPVSGEVTFFGSVEMNGLGSYELEANGPQTGGAWLSIQAEAGIDPISDGVLGIANLTNWLPGVYTIRLNVFDEADTLIGQCAIEIVLQSSPS